MILTKKIPLKQKYLGKKLKTKKKAGFIGPFLEPLLFFKN